MITIGEPSFVFHVLVPILSWSHDQSYTRLLCLLVVPGDYSCPIFGGREAPPPCAHPDRCPLTLLCHGVSLLLQFSDVDAYTRGLYREISGEIPFSSSNLSPCTLLTITLYREPVFPPSFLHLD